MTNNEPTTPRPEPLSEGNGTYIWNEETQNWDYYICTISQGTVKIEDAIIFKEEV